jgi:tetratricopeptide (TPR) repeat protein
LGVAYIEAGHYAEALQEIETSVKRRGEATAVFLDDMPSFRRLVAVPYYLGRAQEGLGMKPRAIENYNAYLALRPDAARDPNAADARRRVGAR